MFNDPFTRLIKHLANPHNPHNPNSPDNPDSLSSSSSSSLPNMETCEHLWNTFTASLSDEGSENQSEGSEKVMRKRLEGRVTHASMS